MTTLVELQARLEKIKKARDSGALSVRHGETSTTFRDLNEMNRIIKDLEGQVAAASGTRRSGPRYLYQKGKGL